MVQTVVAVAFAFSKSYASFLLCTSVLTFSDHGLVGLKSSRSDVETVKWFDLLLMWLKTVVMKVASAPRAPLNSSSVFKASGAPLVTLVIYCL